MIGILHWGLLGVFILSCTVYLIPFIGPSTMVFSSGLSSLSILQSYSPFYIGLVVGIGASVAKVIHCCVSYFAGGMLGKERVNKLHTYCEKMGRWKSLSVFLAVATPIPDEPVLIGLGLVQYSPLRVLLAFLVGKLVVTIPGAYFGRSAGILLNREVGDFWGTIISIVFTVIVTVVLLEFDVEKIWANLTQRQKKEQTLLEKPVNSQDQVQIRTRNTIICAHRVIQFMRASLVQ